MDDLSTPLVSDTESGSLDGEEDEDEDHEWCSGGLGWRLESSSVHRHCICQSKVAFEVAEVVSG